MVKTATVKDVPFYHGDGEIFGLSQWDGLFRVMWRVVVLQPRPVNHDLGSKPIFFFFIIINLKGNQYLIIMALKQEFF